ncbi:MAG: SRPBCC family protein [Phycisphaerales bacterium]|nr:SRPBCC family protein [Phycisphaerales bacterium]
MRMQLSTHIDAPAEAVFAAASDFPNATAMVEGINAVEMLSPANDGSPIGVGTRFRETRTMMGKQATEEMEVSTFDPPHSYTLSALSCGVQFDSKVEVIPDGQGCRLGYDILGVPTTLFARVVGAIMTPLMKGSMRKAMEKDLSDIKAYVENGHAGSSHPGQHQTEA